MRSDGRPHLSSPLMEVATAMDRGKKWRCARVLPQLDPTLHTHTLLWPFTHSPTQAERRSPFYPAVHKTVESSATFARRPSVRQWAQQGRQTRESLLPLERRGWRMEWSSWFPAERIGDEMVRILVCIWELCAKYKGGGGSEGKAEGVECEGETENVPFPFFLRHVVVVGSCVWG